MTQHHPNLAQLESLVTENEAHLFDYQEDGFLLFTKDGMRVHRLTDLTNESIQAAREFLEYIPSDDARTKDKDQTSPECDGIRCDTCKKDETPEAIEQMYTVNLRLDTLLSSDIVSVLNDTIDRCMNTNTTQILLRFQFQEPPDSWAELLESFCSHWQKMKDNNRLLITLSGVFRELSDVDIAFLVKNDIQLEYVYPLVEGETCFSEESKAVISQIAGRGLRLPIVWYIDENTLKWVLPLIDEAMFLSFNSGFSVPLAHHSLFAGETREPGEEIYLSFLADLYEQHVFYDDALFPLNFILINVLKMDKVDFWKIMTFDSELATFSPVPTSALDLNMFAFYSRLFLWQRWESVRAYFPTTKKVSRDEPPTSS